MNVAADVDYPSRQECDYLLEESSVAPLSGRVDDQRRLVTGPFEVLGDGVEQRLGSTRVEGNVVDGIDGRVVIGIGNRGGIDLDATDLRAGFVGQVSRLIKAR
jgi:hypothetical protein